MRPNAHRLKYIDTRWTITRKEAHDGLKTNVKARLCARGFKENVSVRSDSPTADRVSVRLMLAIAGNLGWNVETMDITSAFLQGNNIERDVFIKPPVEANVDNHLWKMKKSVYGLNDASRAWYLRVIKEMKAQEVLQGNGSASGDSIFSSPRSIVSSESGIV